MNSSLAVSGDESCGIAGQRIGHGPGIGDSSSGVGGAWELRITGREVIGLPAAQRCLSSAEAAAGWVLRELDGGGVGVWNGLCERRGREARQRLRRRR